MKSSLLQNTSAKFKQIIREMVFEELDKKQEDGNTDEATRQGVRRPDSLDRADSYLLTVNNNRDGWEKIRAVKKGFSDKYRIRIRGRHHDRKEVLGAKYRPGEQNDIPPKDAEYLAVYIYPKQLGEPEAQEDLPVNLYKQDPMYENKSKKAN